MRGTLKKLADRNFRTCCFYWLSVSLRVIHVCNKHIFTFPSCYKYGNLSVIYNAYRDPRVNPSHKIRVTFYTSMTFLFLSAGAPQVLRQSGGREVVVARGQDALLRLVVCADPRPRRAAWEWGSLQLEAGADLGRYKAEELAQVSSTTSPLPYLPLCLRIYIYIYIYIYCICYVIVITQKGSVWNWIYWQWFLRFRNNRYTLEIFTGFYSPIVHSCLIFQLSIVTINLQPWAQTTSTRPDLLSDKLLLTLSRTIVLGFGPAGPITHILLTGISDLPGMLLGIVLLRTAEATLSSATPRLLWLEGICVTYMHTSLSVYLSPGLPVSLSIRLST
jgi:hypothetical protein